MKDGGVKVVDMLDRTNLTITLGIRPVADFETLNYQIMNDLNTSTEAIITYETAIGFIPCYKPFFERGDFYNEDCNDTIEKLNDNSVDLVFTSPPYYNAREYSQYKDVDDYMAQMEQVFLGIERILKPSRMCVINISPVLVEREKRSEQSYRIPLPFYFVPMMEKIGFEFLEDIIWKKPDGAAANRNGGFYRHRKPVAYKPNIVTEYVLVFKKKANFLIDKVLQNNSLVGDGYERTNVWEIQPETKSWHSAPFPKKLAENVIRYYSYENETVFDCFAGSGTTGKVAETLNRKWIMSEVNTKIFNEAVERWQNGL